MNRVEGILSGIASRMAAAWFVLLATTAVALLALYDGALPALAVIAAWLIVCAAAIAAIRPRLAAEEESVPDSLETVLAFDFGDLPGLLDEIDLAIYLLAPDGTVLFQNRSASDTFGKFPLGSHISARMRAPGVLDIIRDTLANGRVNQIEYSERLPSERVYLVRSAPVSDAERPVFMLVLRDVSEARRIDRMRSDFVANASHEMRTPLASLVGFIETIQGPARNDVKAQERFLGIMLDQASRMSRLIDDLLSLSRLEMRAHVAPSGEVDVGAICHHVIDALTPMAGELGVEISLKVPESPAIVTGDRDELIQVMENLIENACKYGQSGKKVDVAVKVEEGGAIVATVRDYGPGIERQHVPRLTERFYRVDVDSSRAKKGTGLGLAIVKHILTRHRARLVVTSEPGQGSTFGVRFPAPNLG